MRITLWYREPMVKGKREGTAYFRRADVPYGLGIQKLCRALGVRGVAEFQYNSIGNDTIGDWRAGGQLEDGANYLLPTIADHDEQKEFLDNFRRLTSEALLYKARALAGK